MENNIKTYNDLIDNKVVINGTYIGEFGNPLATSCICSPQSKHIASNRKISKSMAAMAMISQLMPYYGGEITDEEWLEKTTKYSIVAGLDAEKNIPKIIRLSIFSVRSFLAFHTPEQRDEFLKYNEDLIKDYLMID